MTVFEKLAKQMDKVGVDAMKAYENGNKAAMMEIKKLAQEVREEMPKLRG